MLHKIILTTIAVLFVTGQVHAGSWGYSSPNSVLKYNGFSNSWGYSQPNSVSKYNGFGNSWDWN